jgi:F0F1-type ATP synthase assembly protein I
VPPPTAYLGLGFEIVGPVVLLMFAGYKVDGWLGSQPLWLLVGGILGIVVSLYNVFRRFSPRNGGGATR